MGPRLDAVWIQDALVPQIPQKWIGSIVPRRSYAANDRSAGICELVLQMSFNQVGLGKNIVIDKQDDVANRFTDSDIPGCCGPTLCLGVDSKVWIRYRFLCEYLLGVVGRGIINDDDFVKFSFNGLAFDPVDCLRYQIGTV